MLSIPPRALGTLVCAVAIAACVAPVEPIAMPQAAPRLTLSERILVRAAGRTTRVDLEEYVIDTILAEVSPVGEDDEAVARIFELQAVIARTYALAKVGRHRDEGYDLCDTTHCQLYQPARRRTSRFAAAAAAATRRTRSIILTYQTAPIEALFHADCGGATASADAVWGGLPVPYLRAIQDDAPDAETHRPWRVTANADRVRGALNQDPRTAVGRSLTSISVSTRDASGRAAGVSIRGSRSLTVRGEVLRTVLNRALGDRALLSTLLTVERRGADYVFSGTGFGHGVGLCQRGAAARLRHGARVADVASLYYPGTRLGTGPANPEPWNLEPGTGKR